MSLVVLVLIPAHCKLCVVGPVVAVDRHFLRILVTLGDGDPDLPDTVGVNLLCHASKLLPSSEKRNVHQLSPLCSGLKLRSGSVQFCPTAHMPSSASFSDGTSRSRSGSSASALPVIR